MSWTAGELRTLQIGTTGSDHQAETSSQVAFEDAQILAPYDRIICQLIAEDLHGEQDTSHEALRRQSYARRVLDRFVEEYRLFEGPAASFRSEVLSPILVRQLRGLSDHYSWPVSNTIALGEDTITIDDVTRFYLSVDPTDTGLIPKYRTGIVGIAEARWHLATVMEVLVVGAEDGYVRVGDNQAELADALWQEYLNQGIRDEGPGVYPLRPAEVDAIVDEGLEAFFGPELETVVRLPYLSPPATLTSCAPSTSCS